MVRIFCDRYPDFSVSG